MSRYVYLYRFPNSCDDWYTHSSDYGYHTTATELVRIYNDNVAEWPDSRIVELRLKSHDCVRKFQVFGETEICYLASEILD